MRWIVAAIIVCVASPVMAQGEPDYTKYDKDVLIQVIKGLKEQNRQLEQKVAVLAQQVDAGGSANAGQTPEMKAFWARFDESYPELAGRGPSLWAVVCQKLEREGRGPGTEGFKAAAAEEWPKAVQNALDLNAAHRRIAALEEQVAELQRDVAQRVSLLQGLRQMKGLNPDGTVKREVIYVERLPATSHSSDGFGQFGASGIMLQRPQPRPYQQAQPIRRSSGGSNDVPQGMDDSWQQEQAEAVERRRRQLMASQRLMDAERDPTASEREVREAREDAWRLE